jgi:hypothetical protein
MSAQRAYSSVTAKENMVSSYRGIQEEGSYRGHPLWGIFSFFKVRGRRQVAEILASRIIRLRFPVPLLVL